MTRESYIRGMAMLESVFGVSPDAAMTEAWHVALRHLSDQQWERAVHVTIQTTTTTYGRFPLPGLILQHLQHADEITMPDVEESERLWRSLLACGVYQPPLRPGRGTWRWIPDQVRSELGDDVHLAVLSSGGYERLEAVADERDRYWARRQFLDALHHRRSGAAHALPRARATEDEVGER